VSVVQCGFGRRSKGTRCERKICHVVLHTERVFFVDWIQLSHGRIQSLIIVKTDEKGTSITRATVGFSRQTLLHGDCYIDIKTNKRNNEQDRQCTCRVIL
jgi:hypothetical protein